MGNTQSFWDKCISLYLVHREDIKVDTVIDGVKIGQWVHQNRGRKHRWTLPLDKVKELDEIGFDWGVSQDVSWNDHVKLWNKHKKQIKTDSVYSGIKIGRWANNVRTAKRLGTLPEDKVERLTRLNFNWGNQSLSPMKERWEKYLNLYADNKDDISTRTVIDGVKIGQWVSDCRKSHRKGKLSEEKIESLNSVGFDWGKSSLELEKELLSSPLSAEEEDCIPTLHINR